MARKDSLLPEILSSCYGPTTLNVSLFCATQTVDEFGSSLIQA